MRADVVILGGGLVGTSTAWHLARDPRCGSVTVVERDPSYDRAASTRGNGGIRRLFSLPENIAMAGYGLDFYAGFADRMALDGERPEIGFKRGGYLFVSDAAGAAQMQANHAIQRAHGVNCDLLDGPGVRQRFPSLAIGDIACAVHSPEDGWIDPYSALQAWRRKARSMGVTYVAGTVTGWDEDGGLARTVTLADGSRIAGDCFVNACGAWAGEVAALIGLTLPIEPMARETYFFRCAETIEPLPFVKTETDLAFRPEGSGYIGGIPDWEVGPGWNFGTSPDRFEAVVWPALANRVPAMQTLRLENTLACHYARNSLDLSPIIGPCSGGLENVYLACGFSGHGIMHAPAAGRAVAELILAGRFESLDLACFGHERIRAGRPYREVGII